MSHWDRECILGRDTFLECIQTLPEVQVNWRNFTFLALETVFEKELYSLIVFKNVFYIIRFILYRISISWQKNLRVCLRWKLLHSDSSRFMIMIDNHWLSKIKNNVQWTLSIKWRWSSWFWVLRFFYLHREHWLLESGFHTLSNF